MEKERTCKHCGNKFDLSNKSNGWMGSHTKWCSKNPNRKEYVKQNLKAIDAMNKKKKESNVASNQYEKAKLENKQVPEGYWKNKNGTFTNKKHTEETKKIISKKRKEWLKKNPNKHPWRSNNKFKSVPCENVKDILKKNNISYVEEYQPLEDRNFSIDIAFPDIKLGIEINGNQHYDNDGNLTSYYQDRHQVIENSGWKLIELHYSIGFNPEDILDVVKFKKGKDYTDFIKNQKRNKKRKSLPRGETIKLRNDKKWEKHKELIVNSDIDFSRLGWVKKVSEILGITQQKVRGWMLRHLPDFYEEKCFKRAAPVAQRSSKSCITG